MKKRFRDNYAAEGASGTESGNGEVSEINDHHQIISRRFRDNYNVLVTLFS